MGKWILKAGLLVATLAAINYPALVNGFPLLYSDSGTYIAAGFGNQVPVDRPFFYPFFVRHASLAYSLWLVLLSQSLVLFSVIRLLVRYVANVYETFIPACLLLIGLAFTTGLAYNNSQLMADAFSPIMVICFGVLFAGKNILPFHRFWLVLVLLFSIAVHGSHLLIISGLAVLLWTIKWIFNKKQFFKERKPNHNPLVFWSLTAWLVISTCNWFWGAGFSPSRTGNIFLMGRLMETGAAGVYLQNNCPENGGELCRYKDSLPNNTNDLLWNGNSLLYQGGCADNSWGDCWIQKNTEYGKINKAILLYPPSRNVFITKCAKDSWKQLYSINLGYLTPMAEGSPVYGGVKDKFKRDFKQYQHANQYTATQHFDTESKIQLWVVILSVLVGFVIVIITKNKKILITTLAFTGCFIVVAIINAIVCASLSCVVDRYMARMVWILPLAVILITWQWAINYKRAVKL